MSGKLISFLLFFAWLASLSAQTTINKSAFYTAIMHENIEAIDQELRVLKNSKDAAAYTGTLLMKKSGIQAQAKDKLASFKEGRKELESAINKDSSNAEYRFLRLLIQENAPKIVNYNSAIKKDALYLRENYKNLSGDLQKVILNYSKKSKALKPEDFKNERHD